MKQRLQHPRAQSPEDLTTSFIVDGQWYTLPMHFVLGYVGRPTNREIVADMVAQGYEWVREGNFLVLYG